MRGLSGMKTFPVSTSDEAIRQFIRDWVALLAEEKYAEATAMLYPKIPPASGSAAESDAGWTPELLKAVINNYGTSEPWDETIQGFKVVPVDESLREDFEAGLDVEFREFEDCGKDYLGGIHVDMPLNQDWIGAEGGPKVSWVSDLTARFYFLPISPDEMALVLLDIHVM